jgi:hypothetical protein
MKQLIAEGVQKKGEYVKSKNDKKAGWGGLGYTDPGLNGLLGYYYDKVKSDTAVELNSCRFNHIGMDNLYRAPPNYNPGLLRRSEIGKCRSGQDDCEDCTTTDANSIYVARYDNEQCTKPWKCTTKGAKKGNVGSFINTASGKLDHCLDLLREWHDVRSDLEALLRNETGDKELDKARKGKHKPSVYQGHCQKESGYLPIAMLSKHQSKIPSLYASMEGTENSAAKKEKK